MNPVPTELVPIQKTHRTFYGKSISEIKNEMNIQEEDIFNPAIRHQKKFLLVITNEMVWLDKKYFFVQVPAKFTIKGYMTKKVDFFQEPINQTHKKENTVVLFFLDNLKALRVEVIPPAKLKFVYWKLFLIMFLIITISLYIIKKYNIIKIRPQPQSNPLYFSKNHYSKFSKFGDQQYYDDQQDYDHQYYDDQQDYDHQYYDDHKSNYPKYRRLKRLPRSSQSSKSRFSRRY